MSKREFMDAEMARIQAEVDELARPVNQQSSAASTAATGPRGCCPLNAMRCCAAMVRREGKVKESVSAADYDKYIALQKSKLMASRVLKRCYNWTLGWVRGSPASSLSSSSAASCLTCLLLDPLVPCPTHTDSRLRIPLSHPRAPIYLSQHARWFLPNYDTTADADDVIVPLNAARLIDDLFAVHGQRTGQLNG